MDEGETPNDQWIDRPLRAHGLQVRFRPQSRREQGAITVLVSRDGKACAPAITARLIPVTAGLRSQPGNGADPILLFPGSSRHPSGGDAGVSWVNEEGIGWLWFLDAPRSVILLPLQGWEVADSARALPQRGRRGPPKSLDLWLAIACLVNPHGIDGGTIQSATGINRFNVHDWLTRASTTGLITRYVGWSRRGDRFTVSAMQVPLLGEFIRASWMDWRRGATMARLRPVSRYFVAASEWPAFAQLGDHAVEATGVTWLEGHGVPDGKRWISAAGPIARLNFFCRANRWDKLVASARLVPRSRREHAYDSEAIIVANDHPLWSIRDQRHESGCSPAWPGGLRALDAMNDQEPRVREAGEIAWTQWLQQHQIGIEERSPNHEH